MFPDRADFFASYYQFTTTDQQASAAHPRNAFLVKFELDKVILLVFITFALVLSIVCGIIAGVFRESLDTGFGVFGAVMGVIGVVEAVLAQVLK